MTDPTSSSGRSTEMKRSSMTPLWVISLFVSLCEVVAGLAVTQASGQIQVALTAFVVGFPVLVAAAFFAILWNRPYVFYPPTEFGSATNVSEYVQALGGLGPAQAAEQQRCLLESQVASPERPHEIVAAPSTSVPLESRPDLAADVLKYFAFRQMRYSDVSNPETRAVFNLGVFHGFNLFDGIPGVAFFGYFSELPPVEIVARVRFLLNNISLSFKRVREHPDPVARETASRILNQLKVEVLVPEDADVAALSSKIEEYRPDDAPTPVRLVRPSDIRSEVEKEYARMGLK